MLVQFIINEGFPIFEVTKLTVHQEMPVMADFLLYDNRLKLTNTAAA
jgi:hypothetical protein